MASSDLRFEIDFIMGGVRREKEIPLERTQYIHGTLIGDLHLLQFNLLLMKQLSSMILLAPVPAGIERNLIFSSTRLTRYMHTKLFMESTQSDGMHVFPTFWKWIKIINTLYDILCSSAILPNDN